MKDMEMIVSDGRMEIRRLQAGPWGTNTYIVRCCQSGYSAVIDAPGDAEVIEENLRDSHPCYILLTHSHVDHIGALQELRSSLGVPLAAHSADSAGIKPPPEILLNDGDVLKVGKLEIEVLHTPGHTPGSLCFRVGGHLISGDTIFPGGPGRTGSPADFKQIISSITENIFTLPDETHVHPGHGESTILKTEKDQFAIFSSRPHTPNLCGSVVWLSS
jgi:glyoxylase-like metal-dependent hydrolase (beta-lactamase superfamily II)